MMIFFVTLFVLLCIDAQQQSVPAYIDLPNTDYNFPKLGFGTAAMSGHGYESVITAINSGIQMVDTAQAREWYDEASVGEAIKSIRDNNSAFHKIVIVTKIHPRSFELNKMNAAIDISLDNLAPKSARSLDVVLLHSPWCWRGHCTAEEERVSWHTGWRNLEAQKRAGRVDVVGVCNFEASLLQELIDMADAKVGVIQNWMDPFHQDKATRALATQHGIIYMAYSSLGTQWEGKLKHNPVLESEVLRNIADKHGISIPRVVVSWVLQLGAVAIPRSTNPAHIAELSEFFVHDAPDQLRVYLDESDMALIESLDGILGDPW